VGFWKWLLEPIMSTPTQDKEMSVESIDTVLRHWAMKLHTDPDPLNRWAHLKTCDAWLDARNALAKGIDQQPHDDDGTQPPTLA
jgi:hypothetical protein